MQGRQTCAPWEPDFVNQEVWPKLGCSKRRHSPSTVSEDLAEVVQLFRVLEELVCFMSFNRSQLYGAMILIRFRGNHLELEEASEKGVLIWHAYYEN